MALDKQPNFLKEIRNIIDRPGVSQPASTIVKNLETAALISKFVNPRERNIFRPTADDESANVGLVGTGVDQISQHVMHRIEDNENIFKLFPDIELAAQIVISSILSPKDMLSSELIFKTDTTPLPPQLVAKLVKVVKDEISLHYGLEEELSDILRDALFKSGSSIKLILPEAAVDHLINSQRTISTESISSTGLFVNKDLEKIQPLGLLGDPRSSNVRRGFSLEWAGNGTSLKNYDARVYVPSDAGYVSDVADVGKFSAKVSETVEVADNFHFLKMPKLVEEVNRQAVAKLTGASLKKRALKFATESFSNDLSTKPTVRELESMVYKSASSEYKHFVRVPTAMNLRRRSVGRPLVMNLPSEAGIPVHVPGDVKNHIGYFVPVDMDGNPLTINSVAFDSGQGLTSMLQTEKSNTSLSSLLTEKAAKNLSSDGPVPIINHITELYADIIENDLMERLLKGSYGKEVQIGRNNEIYRVMLARTLKSQSTRLIYIPAEYVTYFAFNYHRNGVGKSYLDDLSNITSLRAMVLFSKVMANVKSSIATTSVNVNLDPKDTDPIKTIEMAKHLVAKARQQYFPHGLNRVVDLTDWIQRAGIEITFEGHPRLPKTSFQFESKNIEHSMPKDELEDMFRHQTYMHFGLSPETVDSAAKADFATTIEQNSVLFARRILVLGLTFSLKLTEYVQKVVSNDETIQKKLIEIFEEHKGEFEATLTDEEKDIWNQDQSGFLSYVVNNFVESIEVTLPKPDSTKNDAQTKALTAYEEMVTKGLDYIFSQEMLPSELGGKASEYVDAIKAAWKAALMRKWMAENNYAPELFDITNRDEEGKPMADLLELTKSYNENVMLNIMNFIKKMGPAIEAVNKDAENLNPDTSDSGGGEDSGSGQDDGGDDFGFDEGSPFDSPEAEPEPGGEDPQETPEEPGTQEEPKPEPEKTEEE